MLGPYFAGAAVLVIGLASVGRDQVGESRGLDKLVPYGAVLFAVPMAVFGADHFAFARSVASIVPTWMPWHLFWTYFVGTALIASALSMASRRESQLAAALLGAMIFLFVLMIQIPNCVAFPHDKTRYTLVARDLSISMGAFSLAAWQAGEWRQGLYRGWRLAGGSKAWQKLVPVARVLIGIVITDFGIQHFLSPGFAPGIPQEGAGAVVTMPPWIPVHALWAYVAGTIFILCGIALMMNQVPRLAATIVGATVCVLVLFVYLPLTIKNASDIGRGLNYLAIHFALAGEFLLLAGALPKSAAGAPDLAAEIAAAGRGTPS